MRTDSAADFRINAGARWTLLRRLKVQTVLWAVGFAFAGVLVLVARAAEANGKVGGWAPLVAWSLFWATLLMTAFWRFRVWLNTTGE